MQPAVFTAVPFNDAWITHDKADVHAIYRRPIRDDVGEQQLDAHGVPMWDLTGGLPVRRHHDWIRKGFEYVTLADMESLRNKVVVQGLVAQGLKPGDFVMLRNRLVGASPWNPRLYLASQPGRDRAQALELQHLVERLGSDTVRDVMSLTTPTFELPVHLRGIEPGGRVAEQPVGAATAKLAGVAAAMGVDLAECLAQDLTDEDERAKLGPLERPDDDGIVLGRGFTR